MALGYSALYDNTGASNTAAGTNALRNNTTGTQNGALGLDALFSEQDGVEQRGAGRQRPAARHRFLQHGVGVGAGVNLTTGSGDVDIASPGVAKESKTIRIGAAGSQTAAYVAGVYGTAVSGTTKTVIISSSGRLGTAKAPAAGALVQADTAGLRAKVARQAASCRPRGSA